jgi:hypothetical protein
VPRPRAPTLKDASVNGFVGVIVCSVNLPDKIAIAADTQMDDEVANAGLVRGQQQARPSTERGRRRHDLREDLSGRVFRCGTPLRDS